MSVRENAGLRSDGELVQTVSDRTVDVSEFIDLPRRAEGDKDHGGWIEILDISTPTNKTGREADDDDGLPDTIIWCIDGDGSGTAAGEELTIAYEFIDRTWSVNGEQVYDAGMSALLFL